MVEKMTPLGGLCFVFHSHLPYVLSHGRWPHGADWLSEAAAESYIPLLDVLYQLVQEGISPKMTIGLTPILCEQLRDDKFLFEFLAYLYQKQETADLNRNEYHEQGDTRMEKLAKHWVLYYSSVQDHFENVYSMDLVGAFKQLQDEGHIEIITCPATHGYLPLISEDSCIRAQLQVGMESYRRHFGRDSRGIWLPECAYRPGYDWISPLDEEGKEVPRKGIEEFLSELGFRYTIIDSHLLRGGKAIGVYLVRFEGLRKLWEQYENELGVFQEIKERSPYDVHWIGGSAPSRSGEHGYPGDGNYLDFHKKKFPGGHRYWKITSAKADLGDKVVYDPDVAEERLRENAAHFADVVRGVLMENAKNESPLPVVCAPYDTELFGHWWFEGPKWLYHVLKHIHSDPQVYACTASEHLATVQAAPVVSLPEGSWGEGGFHYIWLNDGTRWTWDYVYGAEKKMVEAVEHYGHRADTSVQRLLRQMGRELLLLESSDWQFLMSTQSASDYAEMRLLGHAHAFNQLHGYLERLVSDGVLSDEEWLIVEEIESRDQPFQKIDPRWWASENRPVIS
jgi:1,4-alpha-glucan branching enzyme